MKNILVGLTVLCCLCCLLSSGFGQSTESTAAEGPVSDAASKRAREFQGDDVAQVLRLLARQAKINLVIGEEVKGNISMRLENATALDAIEALVRQCHLSMTKDDKGINYVNSPGAADTALDLIARPLTADRMAAYIHNFHSALVKEGFTKEEALQIVTSIGPGTMISALEKKPDAAPVK